MPIIIYSLRKNKLEKLLNKTSGKIINPSKNNFDSWYSVAFLQFLIIVKDFYNLYDKLLLI